MDDIKIATTEEIKLMNEQARLQLMLDRARRLITEAAEEHKVTDIYALFSGGHDSLTSTHVASQHPLFRGVIHIDTGTGLPETRAFVEQTCKAQGWPLYVGKPSTTYEMLIIKTGFPGAGQHSFMYRMLKERPLTAILKSIRNGDRKKKIGLITGVRLQESDRRMGHVDKSRKDKVAVWINDIYDWAALDCSNYMRWQKLPRSIVKDTMHLSGECFCGSFARPGEYKELEFWYPEHAAKIRKWEKLVATMNELQLNDIDADYTRWGNAGGKRVAVAQTDFLSMCYYCRGDGGKEAETPKAA